MLLFNYSKLFLFIAMFIPTVHAFEASRCLNENFSTTVSHKGWPFGLTNNVLSITKNGCDINIGHERLKYLKGHWHFDVCREPIHMKKGSTSVEVIKKVGPCKTDPGQLYCKELKRLKMIIQDDGLIFAKGDKSDLTSSHGQVYCAYKLMQIYGEHDQILSLGDKFEFKVDGKPVVEEPKSMPPEAPRPVMEGDKADELEEEEVQEPSSSSRSF